MKQKKNSERHHRVNYAKVETRHNSVRSQLASPICGTLRDEALFIEKEKEEKMNRLQQRRNHLSAIVETEKIKYQNEMLSIRQSSRDSTPYVKTGVYDSLHSNHENECQTIVNEELNINCKLNNISSDSIEQRKHENSQAEYWSEQLNEMHLIQRQEEENNTRYEQELLEEKREKRIEQLKTILQQKMDEFKQKEQKSEMMKQETERLIKEQYELDQYEIQRNQLEECNTQRNDGRHLLRQHKLRYLKRSKEIQARLELDMKLLKFITHVDNEIYLEDSTKYEQLKRSALTMLNQFQQQMKLEKDNEQELDGMFEEEAMKQLVRSEKQWNYEKESRDKLMHQILHERQQQIVQKLHHLKTQQQEIYEIQRVLLADIEQARNYHLVEKQKQSQERKERKQNISRPISALVEERIESSFELNHHDPLELEDKKQTNESLHKSTTAASVSSVEPKFYGRRRINWN